MLGVVWLALVALAWDVYETGVKDSVAANSFVTLTERLAEASDALPKLLKAGAKNLRQLITHSEDALEWLNPLPEEPARSVEDLDADTVWAMRLASKRTDISLTYLLNTAHLEANFNPKVKSRTSSAAGLYQFIEQTWLGLVRTHGARYGWGGFGGQIECGSSGHCRTKARSQLTEILNLRYDVMTATFLAAEFARENRDLLAKQLGTAISDTQLYMAHLLGPSGAVRLIRAIRENPAQSAKAMFPQAASANRSLFYGAGGKALSVQQFYENLEKRWQLGIQTLNGQRAVAKTV
jgi:hypothetical protein